MQNDSDIIVNGRRQEKIRMFVAFVIFILIRVKNVSSFARVNNNQRMEKIVPLICPYPVFLWL